MRLELKIPPLLLMFVFIGLVFLFHQLLPMLSLSFAAQSALAALICFAAAGICAVAVLQCHFAGTTVDPRNPRASSELITSGVFRFSRNPMYLGFAMFIAGAIVLSGNLLSIAALPLFVWYLNNYQIGPEEKQLQRKFQEAYSEYQQTVRRWI